MKQHKSDNLVSTTLSPPLIMNTEDLYNEIQQQTSALVRRVIP